MDQLNSMNTMYPQYEPQLQHQMMHPPVDGQVLQINPHQYESHLIQQVNCNINSSQLLEQQQPQIELPPKPVQSNPVISSTTSISTRSSSSPSSSSPPTNPSIEATTFVYQVQVSKKIAKSRLYRQVDALVEYLYGSLETDYRWALENSQPLEQFTTKRLPSVEHSINEAVDRLCPLSPTANRRTRHSVFVFKSISRV